ncbi:MAG: hypothetical protein ABSF47_00560 [Minisyncoccia bacterium]|jgi:hypothetical protein
MENKRTLITSSVIFLIIGLLIGFWGGNVVGNQSGKADAEKQLLPLVNLAFPKPADDIRSFTGTVKAVVGSTINIEINDPADYLPHLDNSPRTKQLRYANTTPDTKFVTVSGGKVTVSKISASNLKTGDTITVRSNTNIKDAQRFDVSEVDLVK